MTELSREEVKAIALRAKRFDVPLPPVALKEKLTGFKTIGVAGGPEILMYLPPEKPWHNRTLLGIEREES